MKSYLQNCSVNDKAFTELCFLCSLLGGKKAVKPQVMGLVDPLNTRIKSLGKSCISLCIYFLKLNGEHGIMLFKSHY